MNSTRSVPAPTRTRPAWGGLPDTLHYDCEDVADLQASARTLLQRLDRLAECISLTELAAFIRSPLSITAGERDYLMSPLLDQLYATFSCGSSTACKLDKQVDASDTGRRALGIACWKGYDLAADFLLDRGAELTADYGKCIPITQTPATPVDAAEEKQAVQIALPNHGRTPMLLAAHFGHLQCVSVLLRHGAGTQSDHGPALIQAAAQGHVEVVDLLLSAGVNSCAPICDALASAATYGHVHVVQRILDARSDISTSQALTCACEHGHVHVASFLLDAGADIHFDHDAALGAAVSSGDLDTVKLLLNRGADVRASDDAFLVQACLLYTSPSPRD